MDYERIKHVIDVQTVRKKIVTCVGCGGFAGLAKNLVRSGVELIRLVDPDRVGPENLCRQDHMGDHLGSYKVNALATELKRINSDAHVEVWEEDFCNLENAEIGVQFSDTDLFIFATDSHRAQARGNEVCLLLNKPGVWIGMYEGGTAGEVFFWKPGLLSCYRCMLSARYDAQGLRSEDPPSDGADVLAITYLDSLAGMVCLGLLTEGADNRYGRLIRQLGARQFLQVKIDPEWLWDGDDIFRHELGIPVGNDAYLSFVTIARRDPDPGGICPDCRRYRRKRIGIVPIPEGAMP